jgi:hypothetical protein
MGFLPANPILFGTFGKDSGKMQVYKVVGTQVVLQLDGDAVPMVSVIGFLEDLVQRQENGSPQPGHINSSALAMYLMQLGAIIPHTKGFGYVAHQRIGEAITTLKALAREAKLQRLPIDQDALRMLYEEEVDRRCEADENKTDFAPAEIVEIIYNILCRRL